MKKLAISDKGLKIFEAWNTLASGFGKIGTFDDDFEIDSVNYRICNISKFRKILHVIVDNCDEICNKEGAHKKISNNDFMDLLFLGILEMR